MSARISARPVRHLNQADAGHMIFSDVEHVARRRTALGGFKLERLFQHRTIRGDRRPAALGRPILRANADVTRTFAIARWSRVLPFGPVIAHNRRAAAKQFDIADNFYSTLAAALSEEVRQAIPGLATINPPLRAALVVPERQRDAKLLRQQ